MAKTCTIIKDGRADTYGRPLLVGQTYTGPDDEVFSLWQSGFASVVGAPGAFMPATQIQQFVIAQSNIPFLIMPGDGAANGCQFTGSGGAFTLSAAINANIYYSLDGCFVYFSAGFGGSSLPAGWYWTEFSSDTAGTVYAETYQGGVVKRPNSKTAITPSLSGWVTGTTNEIVGPQGIELPASCLGKNGYLQIFSGHSGSVAGTKTYRVKIDTTNIVQMATTTAPLGETLNTVTCNDSHVKKAIGRISTSVNTGVSAYAPTYPGANSVDIDTSINQTVSFSLQQSTSTACPVLVRGLVTAVYGE